MTAPTPQQMRELADEFATEVAAVRAHNESLGLKLSGGYVSVSLDKMAEHSAALRTAADQLEAVQAQVEALRMPFTTGKRLRAIHHNAAIDAVLAILTADTAPQEANGD